MDDLVQWLGEQLDEDALWAIEASRRDGEQAPSGGVHWQWEDASSDGEIIPDPSREEFVGEDAETEVSLRSRETWPTASGVGDLPQFAIFHADQVPSAVGGHIVRHDPARVLRDIEAARKLLALFVEVGAREVDLDDAAEYAHGWVNALGMAVRLRASAFSERPGYREEWRPY